MRHTVLESDPRANLLQALYPTHGACLCRMGVTVWAMARLAASRGKGGQEIEVFQAMLANERRLSSF